MADDNKYTRVEYERRFLVGKAADWRAVVGPDAKILDDTYLRNTRLRLRVATDVQSGHRIVKLTKKSESNSAYFCTISRILLSADEHALLAGIGGDRLRKTRHHYTYLGRTFAIDEFAGELAGLVLCEVEAPGLEDLLRAKPPEFVQREVTEDPFFSGASLCRISREDLLAKQASFEAS